MFRGILQFGRFAVESYKTGKGWTLTLEDPVSREAWFYRTFPDKAAVADLEAVACFTRYKIPPPVIL